MRDIGGLVGCHLPHCFVYQDVLTSDGVCGGLLAENWVRHTVQFTACTSEGVQTRPLEVAGDVR